jgi:hypothetical protein
MNRTTPLPGRSRSGADHDGASLRVAPRGRGSSCRTAGIVIAGLLAMTLLGGCKAATQSTAEPAGGDPGSGTYVALGDSYTAAPLVAGVSLDHGCLRSADDYPALVAKVLDPRSFTNVSCYGASTYDITHPQKTLDQTNPPQLSAVSAADSLVTVQVGGDDIGFSRILETCAALSLTDPFGSPCQDHYTVGGTDHLAREIASTEPKITSLLDDIRHRAPHARSCSSATPTSSRSAETAAGPGWPSGAATFPTCATQNSSSTPCSPPQPRRPASATSISTTAPSATTPASPQA